MVADGFRPDVVIGHPGWGETLFIRDVLPRVRIVAQAEFYYHAMGQDIGFDPEFPPSDPAHAWRTRARNAALLLAYVDADALVAPTRWQARSLPADLHPKLSVIHEGIDTAAASPDASATLRLSRDDVSVSAGDEIVTFVNRNLEPYRGFHVLMRALPAILRERPRARVVIVGGTGASYGPKAADGRSWKEIFLAEVRDRLPMDRVHFVGRVPHGIFLRLMQISAAHVYLTYPFVLSWSMLEAMSAGAPLIASRTAPVQEVVEDGRNGCLVDFFDHDALAARVTDVLARPDAYRAMRAAARRTILEGFDLESRCLPAWIDLVEGRPGGHVPG